MAFDARSKVATKAMFSGPYFRLNPLDPLAQGPDQLLDPICQQVEGVLHRSPAQDEGRVQRHLHLAVFQVAGITGTGGPSSVERSIALVDEESTVPGKAGVCSWRRDSCPIQYPAHVVVCTRFRLRIRNPIMRLQSKILTRATRHSPRDWAGG